MRFVIVYDIAFYIFHYISVYFITFLFWFSFSFQYFSQFSRHSSHHIFTLFLIIPIPQVIHSYPSNLSLSHKLFRLVFWELMHQTFFQFLGSLVSYVSPLALRVILAHMGPNKSDEQVGKGTHI